MGSKSGRGHAYALVRCIPFMLFCTMFPKLKNTSKSRMYCKTQCENKPMSSRVLLSHAFAITFSTQASAQEFPAKPIQIVIPYAPGSGSDILARPLAAMTLLTGKRWQRRMFTTCPQPGMTCRATGS